MTLRVLLVDADPGSLRVGSAWLQAAGCDATVCSSFEDAWRILDADPPDLLIADVRLGAFNGIHLVLRTKQRDARVRAVVTSTDPAGGLRSRGRARRRGRVPLQANHALQPPAGGGEARPGVGAGGHRSPPVAAQAIGRLAPGPVARHGSARARRELWWRPGRDAGMDPRRARGAGSAGTGQSAAVGLRAAGVAGSIIERPARVWSRTHRPRALRCPQLAGLRGLGDRPRTTFLRRVRLPGARARREAPAPIHRNPLSSTN